MEAYLQISKLNDFLFCPRSIYFHGLYEKFDKKIYQDTPQIEGTLNHKNIDLGKYSTKTRYLQGMPVYSQQYKLCGKIDIFDQMAGILYERKTYIHKVYDGYIYQMYAQYFALKEMGYEVRAMKLFSFKSNKHFNVYLPTVESTKNFAKLIDDFHTFSLKDSFQPNPNKCQKCIYRELCDAYVPLPIS